MKFISTQPFNRGTRIQPIKCVATFRSLSRLVTFLGIVLLVTMTGIGQQNRRTQAGVSRPASVAPVSSAASGQDFDRIAADANAAREGDRVDEAIGLYKRGVGIRPSWAEGWWYLATLYYDKNDYGNAAVGFRETTKLQPKSGATWAMLGLCEFQLLKYDDSYSHIEKGRELGIGDNKELTRVMRYHEGLLSLVKGEYEKAQQIFGLLSYEGLNSEDIIVSLGLSVLRMGMLPDKAGVGYRDHEIVRRAGLAEHFYQQKNIGDATREYELLAKDYPTFPNVQYGYGRFLMSDRNNDGAIEAFKREIQNSPNHALARIQIAYLHLLAKDPEAGIPYAEQALKLNPNLPLVHFVLGRLLLDANQIPRSIQELEISQRAAPDEARVYFALIRAYSRAGRKADADRARDVFTRLNKKAEDANTAGASAIPDDTGQSNNP